MVNLYKLSLPEGLGHGALGRQCVGRVSRLEAPAVIGHWGGSALDGFPGLKHLPSLGIGEAVRWTGFPA
ncbi:MAG: hypothetical protein KME38_09470 [Spirirestis rafaelensis WJT71-NPBG6]|nr:hypothetical protein [Spirirestis rafaelensis WJT71-NPBG6]